MPSQRIKIAKLIKEWWGLVAAVIAGAISLLEAYTGFVIAHERRRYKIDEVGKDVCRLNKRFDKLEKTVQELASEDGENNLKSVRMLAGLTATMGGLLLASATDWSSYASTAGTISTIAAEASIDGGAHAALAGNETTTLSAGEDAATRVTVTDSEGNSRTFFAGAQAFAATTAPTISGTLQPAETVTLNEGIYSGTTPITITFTLTLDGVDVTGDVSGSDYTIPAGTEGQALVYMETASNGIAPDATQSATRTVQVASGSEMLLTVSGDDLVLSNPQELMLTGRDLDFQSTASASTTIEALDADLSQVVAAAMVSVTGPGVLGTVDGLFPKLGAGSYTFQLRTDKTAAAYTVPDAPDATTTLTSSVSKNGITFNFDTTYPVGQYANGDYFVVAPSGLSITSTIPAAETTSATSTVSGTAISNRIINGLAVNPGRADNGWDSFDEGFNAPYASALNVDPGITGSAYVASPGETLVKAISIATPKDTARPTIERFETLTVVDTVPKDGAFRPPVGGSDKSIPDSWRVDTIDWSRVPRIDTAAIGSDLDFAGMAANALETWNTWNVWGNRVRNIVPATQENYRRQIGLKLGSYLRALTVDKPKEDKMDLMIGLLQIGIDQVGGTEADPNIFDTSYRWDIGRRAPTVLAALLLPENQRIMDALNIDYKWQDLSSFGPVTQEIIDRHNDDTERGAMEGMQGLPEWASSRPERVAGVAPEEPRFAFGAYAVSGTKPATYRKIAVASEFTGVAAVHLFEGAGQIFNKPSLVQYNDRWMDLIDAGWPQIGVVDAFGAPTGYADPGNGLRDDEVDFYREIRGLINVPALTDLKPQRPQPPQLVENGTQIIVKPAYPYVGYGAAQTQMDIRYIPLTDPGTGLEPDGTWTEINDAQPNPNGDYLVSPTVLGGLADNTPYAVAIRYRSANGTGAWSNSWGFDPDSGTNNPWAAGIVTTTTEKVATIPSFNTQPVLDSYFTEGRPIRVLNIDTDGFPVPTVSYQWSLDGTPVPGATSAVFATSMGDAGKTPSVEVTLTNTEGTASTTVTGDVITAGEADTGYRPALYQADGNISIYAQADGPIDLMPEGGMSKATFALWTGQSEFAFQARARSSIFVGNESVSVTLKASGGSTVANYEFGDYSPNETAWYLISIDANEATADEKIKVWRKPEGSPYPAERLPIVSVTTVFNASDFELARNVNFNDYWQRIYSSRADGEFSTLSDYWAKDGVALEPGNFWNDAGYPYNVDNVGTASDGIGVPRVRMGGSMTESQFSGRENSGSVASPLPAESPGVLIIRSGVINAGD